MEAKKTHLHAAEKTSELVVGGESSTEDSSRINDLNGRQEASAVAISAGHLSVGDKIGHYDLLSLKSEDSRSQVFAAHHTSINKSFNLHAFKSEGMQGEAQVQALVLEIQKRETVDHELMAPIYEHGVSDTGLQYAVTDIIQGVRLDKLVTESGSLTPRRTAQIAARLCEAAIHLESRDINADVFHASNIVIVNPGTNSELPKISDLACSLPVGTEYGTNANFSKQIGMLMLEMLSGKHPEGVADAERIANALASFSGPAISLDAEESRIRDGLIRAASKSVRAPTEAYVSTHELLQDLQQLGGGTQARKSALSRSRAAPTLLISSLVMLLGIAGGAYVIQASNQAAMHNNVLKPIPPAARKYSQHIKDSFGRVLFEDDSMNTAGTLVNALQQDVNLNGAEISGVNLSGITIGSPQLENATFTNCHLTNVQILDANLTNTKFIDCKLQSVKIKRGSINGALFKATKLNAISISDSKMRSAEFDECIVGEPFEGEIKGINFRATDLSGISIIGGKWTHSEFLSNMPDAKASFVLQHSVIACDYLAGADFSKATIESCKISVPDSSFKLFTNVKNTTIQKKVH